MIRKLLTAALFLVLLAKGSPFANAYPHAEVHGNIRLDLQYNSRIPIIFPAVPFAESATIGQPDNTDYKNAHKQLLMDARMSQVDVIAWDCYSWVNIFGQIEIDFLNQTPWATPVILESQVLQRPYLSDLVNGDARFLNNFAPRLRLGYFHLEFCHDFYAIIGQYWSQYSNKEIAYPDMVDYERIAGFGVPRNPQVTFGYRYYPFQNDCGHLLFTVGAEKQTVSRNSLDRAFHPTPPQQDEQQGHLQLQPVWVARAGWLDFKPFQILASAATTQMRMIRNQTPKLYKTSAWAGNITAQSEFGQFVVFGSYRYSSGLNHLMGLDYPDVAFQGPPLSPFIRLRPVRMQGWFAGATWNFNPCTSFTFVYSKRKAPPVPLTTWSTVNILPLRLFVQAIETTKCYEAAILHRFFDNMKIGLEFKRWEVVAFAGKKTNFNIFASALWYYF